MVQALGLEHDVFFLDFFVSMGFLASVFIGFWWLHVYVMFPYKGHLSISCFCIKCLFLHQVDLSGQGDV
jgi:hypothetical protein